MEEGGRTVANQGKLPTKEAAAVAQAPYQRVPIPYALIRSLRICTPSFPCVCIVVCVLVSAASREAGERHTLSVSIGTRIIRNKAAATDAKAVLSGEGRRLRNGFEARRARIPTLAAVSPKRASRSVSSRIDRFGRRGRTDRTLEEGWAYAVVVTTPSLRVQRLDRADHRSSKPVLVAASCQLSPPSARE